VNSTRYKFAFSILTTL